MQKIKEQRHISEEMWIALEKNTILPETYMQILEHTGQCTGCADRLAAILDPEQETACGSDRTSVIPPVYLKEQILERTRQMDVQTAAAVRKTSARMQLILYSLRVGAAVLVSVLILGITAVLKQADAFEAGQNRWEEIRSEETDPTEKRSVLKKMNEAADGAAEKLNNFTNQLINGGKTE